jgi:hypothetical protein
VKYTLIGDRVLCWAIAFRQRAQLLPGTESAFDRVEQQLEHVGRQRPHGR